jgi:hypothetical protein
LNLNRLYGGNILKPDDPRQGEHKQPIDEHAPRPASIFLGEILQRIQNNEGSCEKEPTSKIRVLNVDRSQINSRSRLMTIAREISSEKELGVVEDQIFSSPTASDEALQFFSMHFERFNFQN